MFWKLRNGEPVEKMERKGLSAIQTSPAGRGLTYSSNPVGMQALTLVKSLSHVQLFATPWTVAHQASLSMEFSRQEY